MDIGTRLQARRGEFGLSVGELASQAGVALDRLAAIEGGQPPVARELGALSRALAVDVGTLLRGEERSPTRSVARFRGVDRSSGLTAGDLQLLAAASQLGVWLGGLARQLGRQVRLLALRQARPLSQGAHAGKEGGTLGSLVRDRLRRPAGPVQDVEALLADLGVHVGVGAFSTGEIDVVSLWERGGLPVVVIHRGSDRVRRVLSRRLVLAHELCHLVHDAGEGI